jgi:hypothetical protein
MNMTSSSHPAADTASPGSPVDPAAALDLLLGETEVERIAQDIRQLRHFSDLALGEAERLDRAAEARAARLEAAEARLATAADAEQPTEARAAETEAVESLQPSGTTSMALYRLSRLTRDNIMLERKLIADLRAPKTEAPLKTAAAPKPRDKAAEPSRWAKFGPAADIADNKAEVRQFVKDSAAVDARLDQEDLETLLDELDEELASGKFDKALIQNVGMDVARNFLKLRNIKPNWGPLCERVQAEMQRRTWGESPIDTSADAEPAPGPDGSEPGESPPGAPSGAGPPQGSG